MSRRRFGDIRRGHRASAKAGGVFLRLSGMTGTDRRLASTWTIRHCSPHRNAPRWVPVPGFEPGRASAQAIASRPRLPDSAIPATRHNAWLWATLATLPPQEYTVGFEEKGVTRTPHPCTKRRASTALSCTDLRMLLADLTRGTYLGGRAGETIARGRKDAGEMTRGDALTRDRKSVV